MSAPQLLLCAATGVEARACRKGIERAGAADRLEVLETGMGPARAAQALRERLAAGGAPAGGAARPDWIISTGFAGARVPGLEVGTWILGSSLRGPEGETLELMPRAMIDWLKGAHAPIRAASVYTAPQIAGEKAPSLPDGVEAVDMESMALARVAREHGIDFHLLRLVSDTPDRPIPLAVIELSSIAEPARPFGDRLRGLGQGLLSVAREPQGLARFIGQTMPLPRELARMWEGIARDLPKASSQT
jgi:hypothetical protein